MRNADGWGFFRRLGLDPYEARGLFLLLDIDGSGEVDIEEFCCGCLRLKGGAKTVDLVTLMYETKRLAKQIGNLFKKSNAKLERLFDSLQHMPTEDRDGIYIRDI